MDVRLNWSKCTKFLAPVLGRLPLRNFRRLSLITYAELEGEAFAWSFGRVVLYSAILAVLALMYLASVGAGLLFIILLIPLCVAGGYWIQTQDMQRLIKKKEREIGIEFSRFATNCVLMIGAGVSVKRAFKTSLNCLEDSWTRKQIEAASLELDMNMSTLEVVERLNSKLRHPVVAEFSSVLVQFEKYGTDSLADMRRIISMAWEKRRSAAQLASKELETRLVFPGMLMFLAVMLMVTSALLMNLMNM